MDWLDMTKYPPCWIGLVEEDEFTSGGRLKAQTEVQQEGKCC